jgi:predicted Zn-dependent peptidase
MVGFEKHILGNGLRVIVHRDTSTPLAAVNVLYKVGARDEDPEKTGFAHLFEHLMFEGSVNIPDFDTQLQFAGGENNAFTTNDITNYYITIPSQNIETAFWLESDRMLGLSFSEEKLAVQKNVVIEEFRQSYLNQPYGDIWMLLRPLAYTRHPYLWPTIGKDISHIKNATLNDVKEFFSSFYHPSNAILSVAGNVEPDAVFQLAEKWFGEISAGQPKMKHWKAEPLQTAQRRLKVEREVPFDQFFMAFHTCPRADNKFFSTDLLSDVLSNGSSSRLVQRLVKEKRLFSEVNAYITGSIDTGLFIVTGKLHEDTSMHMAEKSFWEQLKNLTEEKVGERELQKIKNKAEASHIYSESNVLAKAMNLAYYELLGDADLLNQQPGLYFAQSAEMLQQSASELFFPERASILEYHAIKAR